MIPAETPALPLPPLESLGVASDYTAFLQKGVGAEVQSLALRRAWESDATIAGFRGMADYDWDFNAPSYGRLWAIDDVAALVRTVLASPPPEPRMETEPVPAAATADDPPAVMAPEAAAPAPIAWSEDAPPAPRRHGSALPC